MQEVAAVEFICKLIWGNRRKYPTVGTQVEAKDGPTKRKPECKNYTKQRAYLTSIQDFGCCIGSWVHELEAEAGHYDHNVRMEIPQDTKRR